MAEDAHPYAGYTTLAEAKNAGAVGSDSDVEAAILAARALIDDYTGSVHAPTDAVIVALLGAEGTALLRWPVLSVAEVATVDAQPTVLPESAYLVTSSHTPGQVDAIAFGARGSVADALIVGAEPWNGGYAGLVGRLFTGPLTAYQQHQVKVTGTFGSSSTPWAVRQASLALTVWITGLAAAGLPPTPGVLPGGAAVDDEGNTVSIHLDASPPATIPTTGLPTVDQLLAGFIRSATFID